MNTVSRGVRNAFRNVVRTGSIVVILSISIGLIITMLAARQAVEAKIESVKGSVGNTVSISPAGVRGFEGGGEALTTSDIASLATIEHVNYVTSTLSDRLTTDDTTSLESGIDLGSLGQRRADEGGGQSDTDIQRQVPTGDTSRLNPMTSIQITGVDSTELASTFGGSTISWTEGQAFDASADVNDAAIGTVIAEKNDLSLGDTFTAYGKRLTVVGVYDAGTDFANNGIFVSLAALQRLSDQENSVTSATATIDSVDNLESATIAIASALGDAADLTNSQETVEQTIAPLESVKTISVFSLVGAIIAGSIIILLTMIMIVRERRREVGVMKAIGASNINIMKQFISEAVALTAVSLIVGLAIGIIAATPITDVLLSTSTASSSVNENGPREGRSGFGGGAGRAFNRGAETLSNLESSVGAETFMYGIGATLLIAILGSAIPSLMISKIRPSEAMRSE